MVNTSYPIQWRYVNKVAFIAYFLFFWGPLHQAFYIGHYSWKRGKLPRLTHNDMKYQKFSWDSGFRSKYLTTPALEWDPTQNNRLHMKTLKRFLKNHRQV